MLVYQFLSFPSTSHSSIPFNHHFFHLFTVVFRQNIKLKNNYIEVNNIFLPVKIDQKSLHDVIILINRNAICCFNSIDVYVLFAHMEVFHPNILLHDSNDMQINLITDYYIETRSNYIHIL